MDLSLAPGPEGHADVSAEPAAQRVLDAAHFGRLPHTLLEPWPPDRRPTAAHAVFDVAHRQPQVDRLLGERRRHTRIVERQERMVTRRSLRFVIRRTAHRGSAPG